MSKLTKNKIISIIDQSYHSIRRCAWFIYLSLQSVSDLFLGYYLTIIVYLFQLIVLKRFTKETKQDIEMLRA